MTTETTTPAKHAKAVAANNRRAATALEHIIERATLLLNRVNAGQPADPETAYDLAEHSVRVGVHLGALEALRDITEGKAGQ
jgi:hypothetical protein